MVPGVGGSSPLAHPKHRRSIFVRSAGSEPGDAVNPVVAQVLEERGLSVADHTPTLLDWDLVQEADIVITMGCGESCPVFPGFTGISRVRNVPATSSVHRDEPVVGRGSDRL